METNETKAPIVTRKRSLKDNKTLAWLLHTILYPALFLGALITSGTMTWEVIGFILPGNTFMQWLSIGFYDGGAFVWWLMHVMKARGTRQRASSLFIFAVDLIGAGFMIYADLYLAGQVLATPPEWLGRWLINATTIVMFANLAAGYYYHANSPEDIDDAQNQDLDDELNEEARQQARATVEHEAPALASVMAVRATARLKARLALPMTNAERAAWDGEIIEGEVVPALPYSRRVTFWDHVANFFGLGQSMPSQGTPSSTNSPTSTNQQDPPADQA